MIGLSKLATKRNPLGWLCRGVSHMVGIQNCFLFGKNQICATGSGGRGGKRGVVWFYPNRDRKFKLNVR